MGGDDSQKLLPWRGIHSSPGRKPPAQLRINNVTETAGWNLALTPPSLAVLSVASATGRLGHFWKAHPGQFWRAPKAMSQFVSAPTILSQFGPMAGTAVFHSSIANSRSLSRRSGAGSRSNNHPTGVFSARMGGTVDARSGGGSWGAMR